MTQLLARGWVDKIPPSWYTASTVIYSLLPVKRAKGRTWDTPLLRREATEGQAYCLTARNYSCMLAKDKKLSVIKKYQLHAGDTGSSEVQIAILSTEIDELAGHLKVHAKDHSSRRGLLRKVGERRRLLRYLKKENAASYEQLVKKLKLKQAKVLEAEAPEAAFVDAEDMPDAPEHA